jgi:hypothetical protein
MRRNYKSGYLTNNTVSYNLIANKIIKDNVVIDGERFSKRIHNKITRKFHEKKIKDTDDYCCDYDYSDNDDEC